MKRRDAPDGAALSVTEHQVRILIVDDNETNRLVATAICDVLGFASESVPSARLAIDAAASGRFDLALMDICMPGMDGVEATLGIRALESRASTLPVIAVTSNAEPHDVARYLAAGMCAVVAKPIQLGDLCQAMDQALSEGQRWLDMETPFFL